MTRTAVNTLGWIGVILIVVAYGLLSFGRISSDTVAYQGLNIAGSILIIIETLTKKDYQPMALNIIWAFIAVVALFRLFS